ncbi:prolyl oligopeptidase family serine peptidase [Flavobacterium sp. HJJ]|uniref:carboxylesterase family protein n=1 Tax=Flavobacterium sp. HJJ TaxID=2783792 RepID=UPI00188A17F6|nr:prolyl oligopeptidase family serine peptidase [Flavobacterium sp. HJJ]MBF4470422.1 prolyl oligopeptidase family serine peptidase [Flavobacterium sp. HJJ]
MRSPILYCLLLILCTITSVQAQLKAITDQTDYPFWINLPKQEILDNKAPVILFLHGKSLSGTNLNRVKRYGVIRAIETGKEIPAIVIAPQVAHGAWDPDKLLKVLEYVQNNYNTDLSKVYVCGMSLGGYGTFDFAGRYPEKITAAVAICGGGNTKDACNLATIPLWVIHGNRDYIVPISQSKKMVKAIQTCNPDANLTFTIVKGGNHGSVEHFFREDKIYNWMLEKSKFIP